MRTIEDLIRIPENLTAQELYIEPYKKCEIVINSTKNNEGILLFDENDNRLDSKINVGDVYIERLSQYTYDDFLLLFSKNGQEYVLLNIDTYYSKFKIAWNDVIQYKLNAKILYNVAYENDYRIKIPQGYKIFTLYINNTRIYDFREVNGYIELEEKDKKEFQLLDNKVNLVVYKENQTITDEIKLLYSGVKKLFDLEEFTDGVYFSNNNIEQVINYEELNYEKTSNIAYYGNERKKETRVSDTQHRLKIGYFVGRNLTDIYQKYLGQQFRIIIINNLTKSLEIYSNCNIIPNITKTYTKEKNTVSIDIELDGRYIISYGENSQGIIAEHPYNIGTYNNGVYG